MPKTPTTRSYPHCQREKASNWKGGVHIRRGYRYLYRPDHPLSGTSGYIREHWLIAEKALGKPLPRGAVVHHRDGDKLNNTAQNLIICEDHSYHMLLHRREQALKACGNPGWFRCAYCHQYDAPENLRYTYYRDWTQARHPACAQAYVGARYHAR